MEKHNPARSLMLEESFGVLSTISVDVGGYPFGSVTPYCLDQMCRPIIYISPIAQHTRNIVADPRVSLTVMEKADSGDVQAKGRVTYIANAIHVDSDRDAIERYIRHFPSSREYDRTHAFDFFRLEPVRIRFIGGFGQIFWMDPREFSRPNPFSGVEEARIIQHMNQDHADVLRRLVGTESIEMVGVDGEGFDILKGDIKIRIPFATPVSNMEDARRAFVEMARRDA
jgi:heme oxygenase (biliverdin-IX-beta and delta-forming)